MCLDNHFELNRYMYLASWVILTTSRSRSQFKVHVTEWKMFHFRLLVHITWHIWRFVKSRLPEWGTVRPRARLYHYESTCRQVCIASVRSGLFASVSEDHNEMRERPEERNTKWRESANITSFNRHAIHRPATAGVCRPSSVCGMAWSFVCNLECKDNGLTLGVKVSYEHSRLNRSFCTVFFLPAIS